MPLNMKTIHIILRTVTSLVQVAGPNVSDS